MLLIKYLLLLYLHLSRSETDLEDEMTTELTLESCRSKNRLIGSDKTNQYDVIEGLLNETIIFDCHYCNENDTSAPKIWYTFNYDNKTPHEVHLDMHKEEELNRISVSLDHSLIIHNSTLNDTGIYYCNGLHEDKLKDVFNYILDLSFNISKEPYRGNLSYWNQYHKEYISPINENLKKSNETVYLSVRNDLKTQLEVITDWEVSYRPCQICGRPAGQGIQEKYGYCRVKIENNSTEDINLNTLDKEEKFKYFLSLPKVSCRSLLLAELFPDISAATKQLNDYILVKKCEGVCNPDAEGVNRGWKFGSSKKFKYRRTFVLDEGAHFTIICPESNLENTIVWRKNGKVLTQGEAADGKEADIDSIHVIVDAFNSLYLLHVTEKEEGNYTCQVDNIRMQQIRIYVKTKSRLLAEEFVRHMKYLAFILIMSSVCYCAGVIAACKRKHKFKTYEDIAKHPV